MNIQGLQKMTLLDFPEHVACTVFLGGCDFRCQFCHNYELVEGVMPDAMSEEEFFEFLSKRHGLLDGVAITGGEPCLRKDLPEFIKRINDAGYPVKLDTNGNHPDILKKLLDEKRVAYVAMDIKNSPSKYAETIGLESFDLAKVNESIRLLLSSDIDYEFRTTVISQYHDENDFREIGEWINGAKNYFLQEFTDRDAVPDHSLTAPTPEEMIKYRDTVSPFVNFAAIRGVDID
ncbi:MAG: anaerobic ribonucleoside-triphosphate reductase activating protein [Firmicutes bacterium]|nr:anaerobic ribonucleoside-triphosphate reductase activating protein [Bacillota bacterium]